MIDGVIVTPLQRFPDARGVVMHMLRRDAPHFREFGEIYFSSVYPGAVKAWHYDTRSTINYAVPHGNILFVLFDQREDSPTCGEIQEIVIGRDNYCLVTVPPGIWNGFRGLDTDTAIVANCATLPHDETTSRRRDPDDPNIPYDWAGPGVH